ncbi:MAG: hypothetical protein QM831_39245 [Kofleriaceae bacterium]
MRSWAILLCLAASSGADTLPRKYPAKPLPPELQDDFAQVMAAWYEHDIAWAFTHLQGINNEQETPELLFDMGVLAKTLDRDEDERRAFKRYLELVPNASDRAVVERELAALDVTTSEVTVGLREMDMADPRALIVVDGVVQASSPVLVKLPRNTHHLFERIAPGHYARDELKIADRHHYIGLGQKDSWRGNSAGNVLISANDGNGTGQFDDKRFSENERFSLPVGHYAVKLEGYCTRIVFDVQATNELTYVYIPAKHGAVPDCRKTDGMKVLRLLKGTP